MSSLLFIIIINYIIISHVDMFIRNNVLLYIWVINIIIIKRNSIPDQIRLSLSPSSVTHFSFSISPVI